MAETHEKDKPAKDVFVCENCNFSVSFDYFGRKPPFARSYVLMEEAYVMKDPFSEERGFITLGSSCNICRAKVCLSQNCSLFYTKRFCLRCVKKNLKEFPAEIKEEMTKKSTKSD
ncbi:cysteine-rich DPF motif domain-containing protein 1-like [Crassostrea angulata]|uniref:cysteine-rich DPF motif domain-containing protein 1-like n=1 Tax=Magallana angulata TaxID=2784310 RepID=UPI0022B1C2E7|nr:cysteine-rich DPF motif domain-containing protein 1-like [Crassostrea angulata]